jgi:hypothetical protein
MNEFKEINLHKCDESAGTIPFDLNKYEEFLKTAIKIPINKTVLTKDYSNELDGKDK